jgi:phosphoglycerate dehydrogenase-like enzyme
MYYVGISKSNGSEDVKPKVLLPWPTNEEYREVIADAMHEVTRLQEVAVVDTSPIPSEKEWFRRSQDATVILRPDIARSRYPEFLAQCPVLRLIQTPSIGVDKIDVAACTAHGVLVCNVQEIMAEAVAQHTWGLILNVSKQISRSDRLMHRGAWSRHQPRGRFGLQLFGKTLGVIGLGAIGGRVAQKGALAFGMRVLAYDPYRLPAQAQRYHARLVDLSTLLEQSDVISIHCSLTAETFHLLSHTEFDAMKDSTILVNTARGSVVDEAALLEAVQNDRIFGAGLDVFEHEPLDPNHPLLQLDQVVLTSHIASSTREAFHQTWIGVITNIRRYLQGKPPRWVINPKASVVSLTS